jgi:hypothetical protein
MPVDSLNRAIHPRPPRAASALAQKSFVFIAMITSVSPHYSALRAYTVRRPTCFTHARFAIA